MKKKTRSLGPHLALVAILILAGYIACEAFFLFRATLTKIPAAESRIYLEQHHAYSGRTEITDPEDVAFLKQLFGRQYRAAFDDPICPFDIVKISFVHWGRAIDFYPAADDCEFVRYGRMKKIFSIKPEEKKRLKTLTEKYWIREQNKLR